LELGKQKDYRKNFTSVVRGLLETFAICVPTWIDGATPPSHKLSSVGRQAYSVAAPSVGLEFFGTLSA